MMASAIYCDERPLRKNVDDSKVLPGTKKWTIWIELIKPKITKAEESQGWTEKRKNWHTNSAVLEAFDGKKNGKSGIYELCLMKKGKRTVVVYIGSSCDKCGLCNRLSQYARDGSHKALLIQKALSEGATIGARASFYKLCETAHVRENEILEKVDYPWNIRSNLTPRKEEAFATALYGMTF